jgi:hypothetical protein
MPRFHVREYYGISYSGWWFGNVGDIAMIYLVVVKKTLVDDRMVSKSPRNHIWLVVWNMAFFHILGMSSSQLTNSHFSEG